MYFFNKMIGQIFGAFINQYISKTREPRKLSKILDLVARQPNLFKYVIHDIAVTTQFGFDLICNRDDYIGYKIIKEGIWEPLISRTIEACLDIGDTAIDVGANIGYDTLMMSKRVGSTGRVIAFEPDWTNLLWLIRNLQLNKTKNVEVISLGLGDFACIGKLNIDGERGHSNVRKGDQNKRDFQSIMITSLERIIDISPSNRIKLVKMDIEGFEYNALVGFGNILNHVDYILCEIDPDFLHQCNASPYKLFNLMNKFGFISYGSDPESNGLWQPCIYDYEPSRTFKSGRKPFDALFCKKIDDFLSPLITK